MPRPARSHLIALAATLLFHAAVVAVLALLCLRYSPADLHERTWPPVDSSELLLGGEFVMAGDTPDPTVKDDAPAPAEPTSVTPQAPKAESLRDESKPAPVHSPVLTSQRPSPAKTVDEEKPRQPTGPTKAEIEAAEKARRQEETRRQIAGAVKFGGNASGGNTAGKAGSPGGNADTGALSGTPGYSLKGRTLASWTTPPRAPLGTVTVRVSVNRQGTVTQASYHSGTGAAAASAAVRAQCVQAAMASRFSVDADAPAAQTGTITYRFQ